MKMIDRVVQELAVEKAQNLQITFYLPTEDAHKHKEIIPLAAGDNKNILIISSSKECKVKISMGYNLIFLNYKLDDQVFKRLQQDTGLSDTQLLYSFVQSSDNAAICLFLDDHIFYADAIKIAKFLRQSLKSNININVYIIHPFINDVLYMHLILFGCNCKTPFVKGDGYLNKKPQKMSVVFENQEKLISSLPEITNLDETCEISFGEYWDKNFYDYEIETVYDISSKPQEENNFEQILKDYNKRFPLQPCNKQYQKLSIDIVSDIEMYFALATLWKNFAKIVHYIKSVAYNISLEKPYIMAIGLLKEETFNTPEYTIFYHSLEPFFDIVLRDPTLDHCYPVPLDERSEEIIKFSFYYYHIFCRLIAIIVYNIKYSLEREQKVKIASKILEVLKKGIGIFPIPVKLDDEWKELNILEIFKYYRQNNL